MKKTTEEDDLEKIRIGFEMFDTDGTGVIDPAELLETMDALNMKEKNPSIYEIIESLNSEKEIRKKGGIKLDELVNYVHKKVNDIKSNAGLRQIYDLITDKDTGTLSMSTFYNLARDYEDKLSEVKIRYLLEKTQMGGSDLTFDEFYTIMKGAGKDSSKSDNTSYVNGSRNSFKSADIFDKKRNSNSTIKENNNIIIKSKKSIQEESKQSVAGSEKEGFQEIPQPMVYKFKEMGDCPNEEKNLEVEIVAQTEKVIKPNDDDISNENNINDNKSNNNNINEMEENIEMQSNKSTPLVYRSYRKVHIGSTPKFEKDGNKNSEKNLKICENSENDGEKSEKDKETINSNFSEGGRKFVEPYKRNSRYRFRKKEEETQNKEDKKEEKNTYYRARRPRNEKNNNEAGQENKVEVDNNNDDEVIIPKRYHRRYRDSKTISNKGDD